ncbi:hypothetical protein [Sphingomonas sp.]|uniref:hypothetical protein n=1 Tax=Sphingomonas sp. TaxID=28214 RepID=UPI002D7E9B1B|nr:hypothetical protein [Sphingomonas sp.]HEU0043598.1 hypothetical protein [Sphingomonas sp.]
MSAGPRIDSYQWSGGREAMLRFGPESGPMVVAALPLLEEANRTRAFVVTILRLLAEEGIGGVLPDLPGTGESLVPTERMRLPDLRAAFAAAAHAAGEGVFGVAVRSGALLDADADLLGRWCLSPQSGKELLREWRRVAGRALDAELVEIGGNLLSYPLVEDFAGIHPREGRGPGSAHSEGSTPSPIPSQLAPGPRRLGTTRVVRFSSDPRDADLKVDGSPLWRRGEPENDFPLAQALAADIARWIATCGG